MERVDYTYYISVILSNRILFTLTFSPFVNKELTKLSSFLYTWSPYRRTPVRRHIPKADSSS